MAAALEINRGRVDSALFEGVRGEWEAGKGVALNDSIKSGLRRKPVVKSECLVLRLKTSSKASLG